MIDFSLRRIILDIGALSGSAFFVWLVSRRRLPFPFLRACSVKRLLCSLAALGLFASISAQVKADYIFTPIDVPGATFTTVAAINNVGQIVGNSSVGPFLLSVGTYTALNLPGPPSGINDSGQIVGSYANHGFLYNNGSFTTLDVPSSLGGNFGVDFTVASGINAAGQIVGTFQYTVRPRPPVISDRGFLFSAGTYSAFSDPVSPARTYPSAINNSGQIVGSEDRAVGGVLAGTRQAFLLSNGEYTRFDPPGSVDSEAFGINNAGQMVGYYQTTLGGPKHGFLFGADLTLQALLDFPGASQTVVTGINDAGDLVGYYLDAGGAEHGFLATAAPVPEPSTLLLLSIATLSVIAGSATRIRRFWKSEHTGC